MDVSFELLPEAVAIVDLETKPQVLEHLSTVFAELYALPQDEVLERLEERESLGSTGFGRAVAIPHARNGQISRPVVAVLRLENPVDFAAADGMPVDLVFGMISPENCGAQHLHALAAISRLVRDDAMHDALIGAPDKEALYALLSNSIERNAA